MRHLWKVVVPGLNSAGLAKVAKEAARESGGIAISLIERFRYEMVSAAHTRSPELFEGYVVPNIVDKYYAGNAHVQDVDVNAPLVNSHTRRELTGAARAAVEVLYSARAMIAPTMINSASIVDSTIDTAMPPVRAPKRRQNRQESIVRLNQQWYETYGQRSAGVDSNPSAIVTKSARFALDGTAEAARAAALAHYVDALVSIRRAAYPGVFAAEVLQMHNRMMKDAMFVGPVFFYDLDEADDASTDITKYH